MWNQFFKVVFAICFVALMGTVAWLSMMVRDKRKKELFNKYGGNNSELKNQSLSVGNVKLRIMLAWFFFACALVGMVIIIAMVKMTQMERLVGCSSVLIVLIVIFQQAKSLHDLTDAEMLGKLLANQNEVFAKCGSNQTSDNQNIKSIFDIVTSLVKASHHIHGEFGVSLVQPLVLHSTLCMYASLTQILKDDLFLC
jgi:hypothetical protein